MNELENIFAGLGKVKVVNTDGGYEPIKMIIEKITSEKGEKGDALVFHVKELSTPRNVKFTIKSFLRYSKNGNLINPIAKGHTYNDHYYPNSAAYDLFEAILASNPAKAEELEAMPVESPKKWIGHEFVMDGKFVTGKDGTEYVIPKTDYQVQKDLAYAQNNPKVENADVNVTEVSEAVENFAKEQDKDADNGGLPF